MRAVRARNEHTKQGELAGAVGDARGTEAEVTAAQQRVADCRAELVAGRQRREALIGAGATCATVAVVERYLTRRQRDLERHLGELLRAEAAHHGQLDAIDAARGRLAIARAEREVIERHFAAWRTERRKLAERRED